MGLFILAVLLVIAAVVTAVTGMARGRPQAGLGAAVLLLGALLALGAASVTIVDAGTVKVAKLFGKMQQKSYPPGFQLVNPLAELHTMNVRRMTYDFTDKSTVRSLSSDRVVLELDIAFPLALNPAYAWKIFERIGPQQTFMRQFDSAARTALRDVVAEYDWKRAATAARSEIAEKAGERFEGYLVRDLQGIGFTEEEARATFTVLPVQLRRVQPPAKVLNAISEKVAAQEDLERQKTLTQIAEETALRRAKEGLGVKKLFEELPQGFSPTQISIVLRALADKARADALMKAVEGDRINIMVVDGGATPAVTLPPPASP
jgi:regulator of protease activity HflC (stomatin/prohibitin superfamily)